MVIFRHQRDTFIGTIDVVRYEKPCQPVSPIHSKRNVSVTIPTLMHSAQSSNNEVPGFLFNERVRHVSVFKGAKHDPEMHVAKKLGAPWAPAPCAPKHDGLVMLHKDLEVRVSVGRDNNPKLGRSAHEVAH
jgi:hypothetical protein